MSSLGHNQSTVPFVLPIPMTALATLVIVAVVAWQNHAIRAISGSLISSIVNVILLHYYPIKHLQRATNLPSLPFVFPDGQGDVEKFLRGRKNSAKWQSEYGGLYRLWSGTKGEIVLTKPAHVEAVFRDSHNHIKATANDSGYLMDRLLGSCLGLVSGGSWNAIRSCVEAPFLRPSQAQYAVELQDFAKAYMLRLAQISDAFCQRGKLHPVLDLKLLPFLFMAKVVYGPLSHDLERELIAMIPPREALFKKVIGGGITRFAFSRFLPLPEIKALHGFKNRWAQWNDMAYQRALGNSKMNPPPVVLMYEAVKDDKITKEQLLQTLDEILFANIDVMMGGLSWTLVFLSAHPSTQESLRSELREHTTDTATRTSYLLSSWTTKPTLLGACILEASRLRPLAAFSVPQACPSPRVLDGFEIPAGTNFVVDTYALNIRDSFWGPDRDKYRPARWLERQKSGRDLRYRYWRFGFGPRTCLGKHLAELMLRAVVVEILENWHLRLDASTCKQEETGADEHDQAGDEDSSWPWDDELWIHSPQLLLQCERLASASA